MANIFKSVEGILNIERQSKDRADFPNLKGKLEPPALKYTAPIISELLF